MRKLNDKYYLGTDAYNYILYERNVVQDKTSKNYGKEVFKSLAYFGKMEDLYNFIIEREIKIDISLLDNIEKIIELKKEIMGEE